MPNCFGQCAEFSVGSINLLNKVSSPRIISRSDEVDGI